MNTASTPPRTDALYEQIRVDLSTGKIEYPAPEGFKLDMERLYRTAALFGPHCESTESAVRLAIHSQIIAYRGTASLLRGLR